MTTERDAGSSGIGIDVGTETSVAASSDGTVVEFLPGPDGDPVVPTAVAVTADGIIAGAEAIASEHCRIRPLPRYHGGDDAFTLDVDCDELPSTVFLRELVTSWPRRAGDATPYVVVPGAYATADRRRVERAAAAAGLNGIETVRSPVAAAAAHLPAVSGTESVLVADVGAFWCDLALVELSTDSGTSVTVRARTSLPDLGRRRFERAVATWAVSAEASQQGIEGPVDCPDGAFNRVTEAAGAVLDDLSETGTARLSGVEVTVSVDGDPVELRIDQPVDHATVHDALATALEEIVAGTEEVLTAAGDSDEVERLLIAGGGTTVTAVRRAIEGAVRVDATPPATDSSVMGPAAGAALLSARDTAGDLSITETVAEPVLVRAATPEGIDTGRLVPAGRPANSTYATTLRTTTDDQTSGRTALVTRHPITGERIDVLPVVVSDIPPGPAGVATIRLSVRPEDWTVAAELTPDDREFAADLRVSVYGEDSLETAAVETTPWLAFADGDAIPADISRSASLPAVRRASPVDGAFEGTKLRAVVERLFQTRNALWRAHCDRATLDPGDIASFVQKFDVGLQRYGIAPIEPEPGTECDPLRHQAVGLVDGEPSGTVVELKRPGLAVDDNVVKPAQVTEGSGIADDDTTTADADRDADRDAGGETGSGDGPVTTETDLGQGEDDGAPRTGPPDDSGAHPE